MTHTTNDAPVTVERELQPCPHCGNERIGMTSIRDGYEVWCKCGATMQAHNPNARQKAIDQWNMRHRLAALTSAPAGDGVFTAAEALCNSATDDCTGKRTVTVDPDSFDTLNAALDAAERIGDRVEEALAAIEQHLTDFADAGDTTDDHDAHDAARKGLATIRLALARPRAAVGERDEKEIGRIVR